MRPGSDIYSFGLRLSDLCTRQGYQIKTNLIYEGGRGSIGSQKRGSVGGRRGSRKGSKGAGSSVSALEQQQIDQRKFKEQQQALRKNKVNSRTNVSVHDVL